MSEAILLPRIIVVVLDDDLLHFLDHPGPHLTKALSRIVDAMISDMNKLIHQQKEFLPRKSTKPEFPKIIWVEAPLHDNFANCDDRIKLTRAIQDAVQFHDDTYSLDLKKIWNPRDGALYAAEYRRYTNEGYRTYWRAIDATIKFADTILFKKKLGKRSVESSDRAHQSRSMKHKKRTSRSPGRDRKRSYRQQPHHRYCSNDRYHWSRKDRYEHNVSHTDRRLPTPPGYNSRRK